MKCYNCDSVITMQPTCPVCQAKIDKTEYELESTKKILKHVTDIKSFAKFIGLFYVKSYLLLAAAMLFMMAAFWSFSQGDLSNANFMQLNRVGYMVFAFIAILAFNFYLEMKKVETFYQDYQKQNNRYVIIWPFKTEYRTIFGDANEKIPTIAVMKRRSLAYEKRDPAMRVLRFNSFKLFHPQKPKLFQTKERFFTKHFDPRTTHYLKSGNYDDESYVLAEGVIHGFLIMENSVITIFNTPKITMEVLNNTHMLDSEMIEKKES